MKKRPLKMFPEQLSLLCSIGDKTCAHLLRVIAECYEQEFQDIDEFEQYWRVVEQNEGTTCAKRAQIAAIKQMLYIYHNETINGNKSKPYGVLGGAPKGNQNARKNNPTPIPNNEYKNNELGIESEEMESGLSLSQRVSNFRNSLSSFMTNDNYEIIEAFARYWTEPTPDGQRLRFELEKTWDLATRWESWQKREKAFTRIYESPMEKSNRRMQEYLSSLEKPIEPIRYEDLKWD